MGDFHPLTPAQQELYDYLRSHKESGLPMPSYRQMMVAMRLKSVGPVQHRLRVLERKGWIKRIKGQNRAIAVLTPDIELMAVPSVYAARVRAFIAGLEASDRHQSE